MCALEWPDRVTRDQVQHGCDGSHACFTCSNGTPLSALEIVFHRRMAVGINQWPVEEMSRLSEDTANSSHETRFVALWNCCCPLDHTWQANHRHFFAFPAWQASWQWCPVLAMLTVRYPVYVCICTVCTVPGSVPTVVSQSNGHKPARGFPAGLTDDARCSLSVCPHAATAELLWASVVTRRWPPDR